MSEIDTIPTMTLKGYSDMVKTLKNHVSEDYLTLSASIHGTIYKMGQVMQYCEPGHGGALHFFNCFIIRENGELWACFSKDKNGKIDLSLNCWWVGHLANIDTGA